MISSSWVEHAPFAFWLVEQHRPRTIVELGTHAGYSLLCFCQVVKTLGYAAQVSAIDTWKGDEHNGFYAEDVLRALRAYHQPRYGAFSTLIQAAFDDALPRFADSSIDMLHIDGRHYYEDVKHDFETWRPKLSERAVVLFHDTQVRDRGFGVHRLWSEISSRAPNFEFLHGNGLGVLGYGRDIAPPVFRLLGLPGDSDIAATVRAAYRRLGKAC